MNILAWIVFGLIVGIIANLIDPSARAARGGLMGAIILGILGALLGGFLGDLVFGTPVTGFNFSSLIIAAVGSLILLFAGRSLRKV